MKHRLAGFLAALLLSSAVSAQAEKVALIKVTEIIATDVPDLLRQLNGRTVKERALKTAGAEVREIPMNIREQVFQTIWRPEVLMILMLIAIYGLKTAGELGLLHPLALAAAFTIVYGSVRALF